MNIEGKISNMRKLEGKKWYQTFLDETIWIFSPKTVGTKSHKISFPPLLFTCLIFFPLYSLFNSNYHAKFQFNKVDFDLESAKWLLEPKSVPAKIWQDWLVAILTYYIVTFQGILKACNKSKLQQVNLARFLPAHFLVPKAI
jgi:hypothetical protein